MVNNLAKVIAGAVGVSATGSVVDCGRFVGSVRTAVVVGAGWVDKLGMDDGAGSIVVDWLAGALAGATGWQ